MTALLYASIPRIQRNEKKKNDDDKKKEYCKRALLASGNTTVVPGTLQFTDARGRVATQDRTRLEWGGGGQLGVGGEGAYIYEREQQKSKKISNLFLLTHVKTFLKK